MKRVLLFVIIVAVIAIAGHYSYWEYVAEKERQNAEFLTLYGNVEIRRVNLGFRVSGRLSEFLFREGDKISKGDLLARLDGEPYEDNLAIAVAQKERAEAELRRLENGPRAKEIEQARATLAERSATVEVLDSDLTRAKKLIDDNVITPQEYDNLRAKRDEAVARQQLAQATLDLLLEGTREEDIASGKAQFAEAKSNIKKIQTSIADTALRAPSDGILLTRVEEPGAVVGQGQIVATLSLTDDVWIYVYIPEPDRGRIAEGMKAEIYTDSAPTQPYLGQIGFISPEAEFTPKNVETLRLRTDLVFRVRVIADNPDQGLGQGMPVTVKIYF